MEIRDKVAIVTGASSGIGLATAKLLARQGSKVVLAARSKGKLEELAAELPGSSVVVTDMIVPESVKNMVAETVRLFGRVDILVNNAGRGYDSRIEEIDPVGFEDLFRVNLAGPLQAMQAVIPHMRGQCGGAIVNVSSGLALMTRPGVGAYSSLKRALGGLSLTARLELEKDGIAVSIVYPSITNTNFFKNKVNEFVGGPNHYLQGDPPELVAERILEAIRTGAAEVFAHETMRPAG